MEITRRTDYAVRVLIKLAQVADGRPVSARALSDGEQVSYAFARSI